MAVPMFIHNLEQSKCWNRFFIFDSGGRTEKTPGGGVRVAEYESKS